MTVARRIVAPIQALNGGGVEKVLLRLAGQWLAMDRRVTLVIGDNRGPLRGDVPAGAEIVHLDDARYTALVRRMPGAVRASGADVLFCPGNHYSSIAAWARLRLGRACPPVIAKVSNSLIRRDMNAVEALGYRRWLRLHPRFLDAVVAMTPGMRDEAIRVMAMPPARVHVIANPAPVPRAGPVPEGRFLLGVGRLAPQKRWDRAIAAMARIADRDVKLVIFGEGSERDALGAQIARLGLHERVALPGYADPGAAIGAAAAVVLTSDFEGVPGILREALAAGTPVVTTDSSVAVREIVTSPAQGSIVAVDDVDALVAALDHWLAPGRMRPTPVTRVDDAAAAYAALFDSLVR